MDTSKRAFDQAAALSPGAVIIEGHVDGAGHRLLAAERLSPAAVVGDDTTTVARPIEVANTDPRRGADTRSPLRRLTLDAAALQCLAEQDLAPESVPAAGRQVLVRRTAVGGDEAAEAAELLHQRWTAGGTIAGICTTAGTDPASRAAVLELPVGRIADSGHPCDRYEVVAVCGGGPIDAEALSRSRRPTVRAGSAEAAVNAVIAVLSAPQDVMS